VKGPKVHKRSKFKVKNKWLKPIILPTLEAEIKRIKVQGQPRQKVLGTPSEPMARYGSAQLSSQLPGEAN
jgi:hypothetical protein